MLKKAVRKLLHSYQGYFDLASEGGSAYHRRFRRTPSSSYFPAVISAGWICSFTLFLIPPPQSHTHTHTHTHINYSRTPHHTNTVCREKNTIASALINAQAPQSPALSAFVLWIREVTCGRSQEAAGACEREEGLGGGVGCLRGGYLCCLVPAAQAMRTHEPGGEANQGGGLQWGEGLPERLGALPTTKGRYCTPDCIVCFSV
jgi:hypothetical protein